MGVISSDVPALRAHLTETRYLRFYFYF